MQDTRTTTSSDTTATFISEKDQKRLRNAMLRMPFSASPRVPTPQPSYRLFGPTDAVTIGSIIEFLDALNDEVRAHVDSANATRRHLNSIEADVEAFRRVIGTARPEVTK